MLWYAWSEGLANQGILILEEKFYASNDKDFNLYAGFGLRGERADTRG
jgi:hypothetical protein